VKQPWLCEVCGATGTCTIPMDTDVFTGIKTMRRAHERKSVLCHAINADTKVRVRNPKLCSMDEWRKIVHENHERTLGREFLLKRKRDRSAHRV